MSTLLERWRRSPGWSPWLTEPPLTVAFEHLGPVARPGALLLDLGSGRGQVTAALATTGATVLGVDVDLRCVRASAAQRCGAHFVVAVAEHLPFATGSIDGLLSQSVLQYTDRPAALRECQRVLKPEGRFAIVENLAGNPLAQLYRRLKRLTGSAYPPHQTPRRHLAWRELCLFRRDFTVERLEVFHLIAPGLAWLPALRAGAVAHLPMWTRWLAAAVRSFDRFVLDRLPWARRLAWNVVVAGKR